MEVFLVSAATGALKPVLEKLVVALGDEYKRFKGVRSQVKNLADELEAMHVFLLTKSEEENPSPQDKCWMQEVRELSYDIEDWIDEFMLHVQGKPANNPPDGFIDKFSSILTKAKARRRVAKEIEHLKVQVKEVGDRNKRYRSCQTITNVWNETVDRRALAVFQDASKLVGIKRPKDELIQLLKREDGPDSPQQPRVVSIVGSGGMGKITLANQVYEEVKKEFECWAFVSVSRNPDMMKVLRMILSEVRQEPYAYTEEGDIQQLIRKIIEFLKDKRYLIVIDDVWKIDTWEIIKCALLKKKGNCRIITTTRLLDVAEACCSSDTDYVYKIRPLSPAASKQLFLKRIFGSHNKCPEHLIELSNKILRKCDGLPLSIISVSGLLANKPQSLDHWDPVQKSIARALGKIQGVQSMMQILSLSYFDLPQHLRTCLLYLSTFPENSIIDKRRLIRKWTAEGFIQKENGHTLYELGERCFNELINRSLIQAHLINIYGEVTACQVHDTILDFISLKSEEQNFVTALHDGNHEMFGQKIKVRRLSLHGSSKTNVAMSPEMDLSHVRSLTYHMKEPFSVGLTDFVDLSKFKFLRVLDFEGCRQLKDHHLANIWNLFQLKYLSLCGTGVCHLPEQINKLHYLETLNTQNSSVRKLPTSITELRGLAHLIVGERVKLPNGIGGMVALEILECVDVFQQSIDITIELGQLSSLRSISLFLNSEIVEGCRYKDILHNIVSSLCNLGRLRSLIIDIQAISSYLKDSKLAEDLHLDSLDPKGSTPISLQKIIMTEGFLFRVPNWMGYLSSLQLLILYVKELEVEDVLSLGQLPALEFIQLITHKSFQGRKVTIWGSDGFQCLRHFDFRSAIPLVFEVGAMPKLEKLTLVFNTLKTDLLLSTEDFSFGIEHLSGLKSVHCILHLIMDEIDDWIADKKTQMAGMNCKVAMALLDKNKIRGMCMGAGSAIERAVYAHPKSPKFVLRGTSSWGSGRYDLLKSSYKDIFQFYRKFECKVNDLRMQVEERNCQLEGNRNCDCQGSYKEKVRSSTSRQPDRTASQIKIEKNLRSRQGDPAVAEVV